MINNSEKETIFANSLLLFFEFPEMYLCQPNNDVKNVGPSRRSFLDCWTTLKCGKEFEFFCLKSWKSLKEIFLDDKKGSFRNKLRLKIDFPPSFKSFCRN
jgi:hypothetical protein